jgi:hypothetical protein
MTLNTGHLDVHKKDCIKHYDKISILVSVNEQE